MKKIIVLSIMLTLVAVGSMGFIGFAYAQYMGNVGGAGETGAGTLEETLELARRRIEAAEANPASGSGTPYLDADGVLGAAAIAGAVFGGIAGAFFFRGRSGKYAAQGRG
ncbi:MAG TPA: hypothetical protein VFG25_01000 [Nitrosopumilaceae archaeon]|nr:hypothetical protein [Nitrosopumilaceae archaeon]